MKIQSCSSTNRANCLVCENRTGNYKVYIKYGIKLYLPLCSDKCYKFSGNKEMNLISKEIKEIYKKSCF